MAQKTKGNKQSEPNLDELDFGQKLDFENSVERRFWQRYNKLTSLQLCLSRLQDIK